MKEHKFWSTQPTEGSSEGEIKKPSEIPTEPYTLSGDNKFVDLSIDDLDEIYSFLAENYVEDQSENFRLCYSKNFLLWQINCPGSEPSFILGIRNKEKTLVGFVFARKHKLSINAENVDVVNINYLCLVKDLRGKYFAPIIIKEITRRANLKGINQAVFTGNANLPNSFTSAGYYHRPLNIDKLVDLDFCDSNLKKRDLFPFLYENILMRENTTIATEKDLCEAYKLYIKKAKNHRVYEVQSLDEFIYNQISRDDVVYSLVHKINGIVVSYASFFIIDTFVVNKNNYIKTAYLYYHAGEDRVEMMNDIVVCARGIDCDMFNLVDIADNDMVIPRLFFARGDTDLHYYLYNWHVKRISNRDVHLFFP